MFGLLTPWREGNLAVERNDPIRRLRDEVDTLFDRFNRFTDGWMIPADFWKPTWAFDVEEAEKEMVLRAEMPGFEPNEVEVVFADGVLTVRAETKKEEVPGKEKNGVRESRRVERSMLLPEGTEPDKIAATFRNGVLEVHVPRPPRAPEAVPRRIEVKT